MRLSRLSLENVRSHKTTEILFDNGITVIMGRTGSGKSSILMAIDYALFGSENISNNEIIRRGAKNMRITLEFEHNNKRYTITRGLKKAGEKVSIDFENLNVTEDGKKLNILSRAKDVNEIIQKILGYPNNVKMTQMFQVTTYTRQDEIRKLIEMKTEERQEYIDKILQLSKYKGTYDNLKEVITHFKNKMLELERINEFKQTLDKDLNELGKQLTKNENDCSEKEKELLTVEFDIKNNKIIIENINKDIKLVEKSLIEKRENNNLVKSIDEQLNNIRLKQDINKGKKEILKGRLLQIKTSKNRAVIEDEIKDSEAKINIASAKLKDLNKDFSIIGQKGSKCPLCKQLVTENHIKGLESEYESKKKEYENEKNCKEIKLKDLKDDLKKVKEKEDFENQISNIDELVKQNEELIDMLNKKKGNKAIIDLKSDENDYNMKKEALDKAKDDEKRIFSRGESLKDLKKYVLKEISKIKDDIGKKELLVKNYVEEIGKKKKVEYLLKFLNVLRDNVKDIRGVIRQKFLLDFRYEFQQKFEEIRKQEDEYSVEVGDDYEPVAYTTKGEPVPINHLSGGEKTSVALAYRLALSSLASQMNNVMPSTLLILDEPTTGFDEEDIKTLPQALRNITSISQIIIVTHENALKEIADHNISIVKKGNNSIIEKI
ncbi:DNA double-strand break repair Rad50 ATPase [Candidatus Tiddalikarchaeum anstoanum]|nr:DNA double-strand break repair Rad50 ATPase [Candidatus Tiddalikarchaeum anstoanum]